MKRKGGRTTRVVAAAAVAALLGLQVGLNVRMFLAEAYATNATAARQSGDALTRAWSLERAATLAPFRSDLAHELGAARHALGDLAGAQRAFEDSLALGPYAAHTLIASTRVETELGNFDAARERVARVRAMLPDYWRVAVAAAAIDLHAGDPNKAVETLRAALELPGVERGPVMALLARAYAALGDSEQALTCTEEAATLRR
ncbi:MAG: hypothetical protein RBU21_03045 [FCB group bacterium]|jgi:tetratricopeptide (TPR) repeat protein|nr:hypothetical protein [FCB group bacterium]